MAFHIRDPETDRLARELARIRGDGLTEAVKTALKTTLAAERKRLLSERIKNLSDRVALSPDTGLQADKAFFDELWGQGES